MGSTSSFFGGGGGDTNKKTYRPNSFNTITFATNSQFTVPNTNRGQGAKIIPNTDTTFWLLEGNNTSDVYASYWSLDSSTGACTQTYSAVQLSGCDEVASASANGLDDSNRRLIVLGGTNYDNIYHVRMSGSALTASSLYSWSQTNQAGCVTCCANDGTLYASMSATVSSSLGFRVAAIRTDGTTFTSGSSQSNIQSGSQTHRAIGTEDGIVAIGPHWSTSYRVSSMRYALEFDTTSSLNTIYGRNLDVDMNTNIWGGNTDRNPFMVPTQGGVRAYMQDNSFRVFQFNLSPSYYGAVFPELYQPITNTPTASIRSGGNSFTQYFGAGENFARQANGTYQHFLGGTSPSNYVTFNDTMSYKLPFYTGRLVGNSSSSATRPSSAIVGDYVLKAWYDEINTKVNIDAWNFRG